MIESRLLDLIKRGHRAASFQLEEVGGLSSVEDWRCRWLVDDQVECRVRLAEAEGERVVPLEELFGFALDFTIEDVAPTKSVLLWQAVAVGGEVETLVDDTQELTVYATTVRDDVRGLAALVYSKGLLQTDDRRAGDRVTKWLQKSWIPGAAGRVDRAREQLSADESRAATAAAAAEHLQGDGAREDGGVPPVELSIVATNMTTGRQRIVASIGAQRASGAKSKRRAYLFESVLRELEGDAFGSRSDADRAADGTFEPLVKDEYEAPGSFEEDVETRLAWEDLVDGAGLSDRELDVLDLLRQDKTHADIASTLGIAEGTVSAHVSAARRKLEAARENFSDYHRSA